MRYVISEKLSVCGSEEVARTSSQSRGYSSSLEGRAELSPSLPSDTPTAHNFLPPQPPGHKPGPGNWKFANFYIFFIFWSGFHFAKHYSPTSPQEPLKYDLFTRSPSLYYLSFVILGLESPIHIIQDISLLLKLLQIETKYFQVSHSNFIKSSLSNGSLMGPSFSLFNQFILLG